MRGSLSARRIDVPVSVEKLFINGLATVAMQGFYETKGINPGGHTSGLPVDIVF